MAHLDPHNMIPMWPQYTHFYITLQPLYRLKNEECAAGNSCLEGQEDLVSR